MKNYYEILEVDKNASNEVIEKAYRALAKKYHPDLQQGINQQECAEKMKIINQAYDILSNNASRATYDEKLRIEQLQNEALSRQQQERIMQENYALKQELNRRGQQQVKSTTDEGTILNMSRVLNQQMHAAKQQAYYDAYVQELQRRGYKIKYKHDFKYYLKAILLFIAMIFVCFILYQIPPIKQYFQTLYNENIVIQTITNIFKNTFSVGF